MSDTAKIRDTLMTVLDEDHADGVIEHRKKTIRKPFTPFAAKLLAKEFGKCVNPNRAAEEMILRNWQGFRADWMPPQELLSNQSNTVTLFDINGGRHGQRASRSDEIGAAFDRRFGSV